MRTDPLQRPCNVRRIVACKTKFGIRLHHAGKGIQRLHLNEPPLVMTLFRPGIGKQQEHPPERCIRQRIDNLAGISSVNPDPPEKIVSRFESTRFREQLCHTGFVRLGADDTDPSMLSGLLEQVLAGAETDLEPDFIDVAIEIVLRNGVLVKMYFQPWKKGLDKSCLMGGKLRPLPAAVQRLLWPRTGTLRRRGQAPARVRRCAPRKSRRPRRVHARNDRTPRCAHRSGG